MVELVMVVVIMGILVTGARSLFLAREDVSGAIVREQLITSIRLAQQNALARTQASAVTHTVSLVGTNYRFVVDHPASQGTRTVEGEGSTVTWSCASVTGTLPHTLNFDTGGSTATTRYCITGAREYSVCVSGQGFAYEGVCDT